MFRIIAGIIVGFIVMFVLVMATFGITMMVLGLEGTLQPGSYWTTNTFNIIVLIGGTTGAIIGGLVCGLIARRVAAGFALAVIVLVMGVGSAVANMSKPDPPARAGAATLQDISQHGKEPTWFAYSKAALGALGVFIGASMVKKRGPTTNDPEIGRGFK